MAQEANIVIRLSDGKVAGQTLKELKQDANRLTKEVSNLKPGTEAFVKKSADLQKVQGRLKDVRGQVNGVTKANNMAVESFLQYIPFGPQLGGLAKGFNTVTGSTKTFGMALKAIPILALIAVIVKLVQWFMQTQEAMDALTSVTRPLQAIFQRLIGVGQTLMSAVFSKLKGAIKDPMGALKELGETLKENVINRFEAFGVMGKAIMKILRGDLKEGFKELGNGVIQASTGIEDGIDKLSDAGQSMTKWVSDGIDAGRKLDELQKEIERSEINLTKQRAILNQKYHEAREIAKNTALSEAERMAATKRAQEAENQLLNMEQRFRDLKIAKMEIEHDLNDTSRADELELAKLQAERTEFAAQAANKRVRSTMWENSIRKSIADEERKRLENLHALKFELMEEGIEKELLQLELDTEKRIEALTGSEDQINEQKNLILEMQKRKEQQIRDKYMEEELKKNTAHRYRIEDLTLAIMDEGFEKELAKIQLETQRKIEALTGSEAQIEQQRLKLIELQQKKEAEVREEFRKKEREKQKEHQEAIAEIMELGVQTFNDNVDATIAILGKDEEARKRNANIIKAIEKGRVAINLLAEIQSIWKWANASPLNAILPGAGTVIAIGKTVAAGLRAKAAINQINSTKLSKGGILRGPRHSQGGIPGYISSTGTPIEMEDYEIVLNRNVGLSPQGRAMASKLNEAYGGRKFELGGPVNPFAPAASTTTTRGSSTFSSADLSETNRRLDGMVGEIKGLRADMNQWQREFKVYNVLQETREGIGVINRLEERSGI